MPAFSVRSVLTIKTSIFILLCLFSGKIGTIIIDLANSSVEDEEMKLSILDQAPITTGNDAQDALRAAIRLAQVGEKLGYKRYWIAEHHDLFGLACPNPDVMIGAIGQQTNTIRLGAGAVLLPYYRPYRVAETYNLLATLYPNRIDLGLGRAPGGSAEVSLALSENYLKGVKEFPEKISELLTFLYGSFPEEHTYHRLRATPVPNEVPETWLLGTSEKSAYLAAEKQLPYAFGHFMSDFNGPEIVKTYRKQMFQAKGTVGKVIVALHVICAETKEEAEQLALSSLLWKVRQRRQSHKETVPSIQEAMQYRFSTVEKEQLNDIRKNMIVGSPEDVKRDIASLYEQYEADEWMILSIIHDEAKRQRSYELLADLFIS